MPDITINGRVIAAKNGMTVLDAALSHDIDIPHICDHPHLEKYGGCRMCLVSVEGTPRLLTSCTLKPEEGMVIETESPEVIKARKSTLEFMLINHPLECPSCDKAGICKLQDYAVRYGAASGRFEEKKIVKRSNLHDPLIKQNMGRCIMCTRCVRMCDGVQGAKALAPVGRGNISFIAPFAGERFDCEYCGNCISACPVGALTSKACTGGVRSWDMDRQVESSCPHCGMGCRIMVESKGTRIQRISPRSEDSISKGILCARGSFAHDFVNSPERLTSPLIRENGVLRKATWPEALERVAGSLLHIRDTCGGSSIAGVASAYCTNEDNYMFQKFIRSALGSNNVDSPARMGIAGSRPFIEKILGPGATMTPVSAVSGSDAVIVVGGDPVKDMPVLGVNVRQAFARGATVVSFGHVQGLARQSTFHINVPPGRDWPAVEALLENLLKHRKPDGRDPAMESIIASLELPGPGDIPDIQHEESILSLTDMLKDKESVTIVVGREAAAHKHGSRNLLVLCALGYVLNASLILSSEGPNENGLLDMGCVPDHLPAGRLLTDETMRAEFEKAWGCPIPSRAGLGLMEMFEAAHTQKVKAMYVMGANPVESLPGSRFVQEALGNLEMLVVQDIFMTETALMADVVLPAASWGEKDGTYTNVEQQTVRIEKVIESENRPDWQILADLSALCNVKADYKNAKEVMAEAERLSPDPKQRAPQAIRDLPDISGLYPVPPMPEVKEYYLELEKAYFSTGTLTRNSISMMDVCPAPALNMNPATALGLDLKEGDEVAVSTDHGSLVLPVKTMPLLTDGTFVISGSSSMNGIMGLFECRVSRFTSTPYASYSGFKISKCSNSHTPGNALAFK